MAVRQMILNEAPDMAESMNYKMLRYGDEDRTLCHLNAQRNYVSLYVGDAKKIDPDGSLLKGLDVGKGCIRIKKSVVLENTQLAAFVQQAVSQWRAGENLDC